MNARKARRARRSFPPGELMLAAMVDMMINLLVFLLMLYGTSPAMPPGGETMQLAGSSAREPITVSAVVVITTRDISVDGVSLVRLEDGGGTPRLGEGAIAEGQIPALERALAEVLDDALARIDPTEREVHADLVVQCDRRIPWEVLGPVVRTAGHAGFGTFRFVVRATGR